RAALRRLRAAARGGAAGPRVRGVGGRAGGARGRGGDGGERRGGGARGDDRRDVRPGGDGGRRLDADEGSAAVHARRAAASVVAATALTWRLGPFSPAPMLTTLGIAFFGLGEDKRVAYAFTAVSSV